MSIIFKLTRVVSALLHDPLLFLGLEISLEVSIVIVDDSLQRIIITVTNIISSLRNWLGPSDIVGDQSFFIRSKPLQLLGVESSVLYRTVIPALVFEF